MAWFTQSNLGRAFANCLTKLAQKNITALGRRECIPDSLFPIWASFTSAGVSVGGKRMMVEGSILRLDVVRSDDGGLYNTIMGVTGEVCGLCYGVKRAAARGSGMDQNPQTPTPNLTPTKNN